MSASDLRDDLLNIVRVVVLAVDDDDVLLSARDHQVTVDDHSAIARPEPAVRREQRGGRFVVAIDLLGHARAAQLDVTDTPRREYLVGVVGEPHFAVAYRLTDLDETDGIRIAWLRHVERFADAETVAMHDDARIQVARRAERHADRRLGEAIHREHRRAGETIRLERVQECLAKVV